MNKQPDPFDLIHLGLQAILRHYPGAEYASLVIVMPHVPGEEGKPSVCIPGIPRAAGPGGTASPRGSHPSTEAPKAEAAS